MNDDKEHSFERQMLSQLARDMQKNHEETKTAMVILGCFTACVAMVIFFVFLNFYH